MRASHQPKTTNIERYVHTHRNSSVYVDLYLYEPQVFVVFADHLQLVVETVGHDHVPGIVHHQRVGATEFQLPFAVFSEKTGGAAILDNIDAMQPFI